MIENFAGMWTWGVLLWFAIGLILGIGLTMLVRWLKDRNIKTSWYDWLIGLAGVLLFFFTFQNFYASFMEDVAQASLLFLAVTGLPSLILMAIPTLRVWRRNRANA